MSERTRFVPFSCGSEKADWHYRNCNNCRKGYSKETGWNCEIERALDAAFLGDGSVSNEIGERMGGGRCPEQSPIFTPESWAARNAMAPTVLRPLWWRLRETIRSAWGLWIPPWDRTDHEHYDGLRSLGLAGRVAWGIWGDAKMVRPGWVRPSLVKVREDLNEDRN